MSQLTNNFKYFKPKKFLRRNMCWGSESRDPRCGENLTLIQIQRSKKPRIPNLDRQHCLLPCLCLQPLVTLSLLPLNFIFSFRSLVLSFLSSETFREASLSLSPSLFGIIFFYLAWAVMCTGG